MNLAAWNTGIDAASPRSPAAIGRWLLWVGGAGMLLGIFLTPPWGLFGIALAIIGVCLARPPILRLPVVWVGVAFGAWILAGNLAGWLRDQPGCGRISSPAYSWLAIPLTAAAAADPRWRRIVLRLLVGVGAVAVLVSLLQFTIGIGEGPLRIDPAGRRFNISRGFSAYHLSFGFACAILAALCVPASLIGTGWLWAGRIIGLTGIAISGARACMLGGTAAFAAALAARGGRWLLAAAGVAILLGGLLLARMAVSDPGRLRSMLAGQDGRLPIWQVTAVMIGERPLLGIGSRDAFKLAWNETYARVAPGPPNEFGPTGGCPHAHNWLLAVAAEFGIPAALLHLAVVLTVLVLLWRRREESPEAFQAGCGVAVAALVCAVFEPLPTMAAPGMGFHAALGYVLGKSYGARPELTSTQGLVENPVLRPGEPTVTYGDPHERGPDDATLRARGSRLDDDELARKLRP